MNISIRKKLIAAFTLLIAFSLASTLLSIKALVEMHQSLYHLANNTTEKIQLAKRINQQVNAVSRTEKNIILSSDENEILEYIQFTRDANKSIDQLTKLLKALSDDKDIQLLNNFSNYWQQYQKVNKQILDIARTNNHVMARKLSQGEAHTAFKNAINVLDKLKPFFAPTEQQANPHNKAIKASVLNTIRYQLTALVLNEKNIVLSENDAEIRGYMQNNVSLKQTLDQNLDRLYPLMPGKEQRLINLFQKKYGDYLILHEQVINTQLKNIQTNAVKLSNQNAQDKSLKALQIIAEIVEKNDQDILHEIIRSDENLISTRLSLFFIIFGLLLIALCMAFLIFKSIGHSLENTKSALKNLIEGNFEEENYQATNDEIGQLIEYINLLSKSFEQSNWLQQGQVKIANALHKATNLESLSNTLLETLATYVNANVGSLYYWVEQTGTVTTKTEGYLELSATFAHPVRKQMNKTYQLGESLVGQAGKENQTIILENIPHDYLHINSGLGESVPSNLILFPFDYNSELRGVIELGFMNEIDKNTCNLLELIRNAIGIAFENMNGHKQLQLLLEESKSLEAEIRINEQHTSTIIESTLNSIITITPQGIIESCNSSASRMFGFSKDEMLGNNVKMLMPEGIAKEHDGYLTNYLNTGKAKIIGSGREVIAQRKDGSQFHIHLSIVEIKLDNKLRFLGTVTDISEQVQQRGNLEQANLELQAKTEDLAAQQHELRQINENLNSKTSELEIRKKELEASQKKLEQKAKELSESSRYKSEFLANMSHELRTPLNSLLILAKFLAENEDGHLSADEVESAEVIHESGANLLQLINDILDLSKIEAGHMKLHRDIVLTSELIQFLNSRFKHMAENKGLAFNIACSRQMPEQFISDFTKLGQILTNLISNAIKFTDQGEVMLKLTRLIKPTDDNQWLIFEVIDSGVGIPEEKQKSIFEAFQQADGSTSRQFGGTGLGLSIAQSFSELMQGNISLKSEVNQGSHFSLNIPYLEPENSDTTTQISTNRVNKHFAQVSIPEKHTPPLIRDDREQLNQALPIILIIEDDAAFSNHLQSSLAQLNVQILHAPDGETGLTLAKQYQPTGIILDYMLPGIDGSDVLAMLRSDSDTKNIPVHVISAIDDLIDMSQLGAIGQVTKPISKSQIIDIIEQLTENSSSSIYNLLLIEDNEPNIRAMEKLLAKEPVNLMIARNGQQAIELFKQHDYRILILDLMLPDTNGLDLLEALTNASETELPPVIVCSNKDLTDHEYEELQKLTSSIIIKSVKSSERLIDEIHLFIDQVQQKPVPSSPSNQSGHTLDNLIGKRILLVDDDMRNTFSLAKVLRKKGLMVQIAPSGENCLSKLQQEAYDLILMDIMMPGMDGYETMHKIRNQSQHKDIAIIALTANAMRGDKDKCINAGANDYLAKPVDTDQLLSQIQHWLKESSDEH